VDESPTNESQRIGGMRIQPGHLFPRVDSTEQRVLGIPLSWYRTSDPVDRSGFRHPFRWIRWRIARHRRGPFAPGYREFMRGPDESQPSS
jgi:hypothetical protein